MISFHLAVQRPARKLAGMQSMSVHFRIADHARSVHVKACFLALRTIFGIALRDSS